MKEENIIFASNFGFEVITCKILGMEFKGKEAYLKVYDTVLNTDRLLKLKDTYLNYKNLIEDRY
jgi:hypothetical protein